jgi:hypothetical protein
MVDPAASAAVGAASSLALFGLALSIMVWPLAKRILDAHRQRTRELSAAGLERK